MSNLLYLGIAVLLSVIGCVGIWFRNRRPHTMDAQIREFAKGLDAIAPEDPGPPTPPQRGHR